MTRLTKLFEPGQIGTMQVRNRLVMAAMGTSAADGEGYVTDRMIDFYVERAKGGVGLIIGTGLRIRPQAQVVGQLSGWDDKFVPQLRQLSRAVQEHGAKMALQVNHRGRALSLIRKMSQQPDEVDLIGPSALPFVRSNVAPREASREGIRQLVEDFAEAARRAKDAGFDAIEFHGAHGALISNFLSPFTNRRADEYGGDAEKRARFACEILTRTRQKVGTDFPIIFRVSGSDYVEGGTTIEDTLRQAPLLVEAGAGALHVSASTQETTQWQHLSYLFPDGAIAHLAAAVKKVVNVPIIAVGKIGPLLADRLINDGKADFVAMARGLLADPELPNKAKAGRFEDIRRCIYCNNCHSKPREDKIKFGGLFCTVNPALFREREFTVRTTIAPRKIMVVGGGLAGMEAARVLAERGHEVTLYEKSNRLGGQWNIAAQGKSKRDYASLTEYMSRGLESAKVKITLNKEVTARFVKETGPDVVVLATGAVPATLDVPGADGRNVVPATDVITGKARVGQTAVVVGGRLVGMEVADLLAQQGKKVSLVTEHRLGENGKTVDVNIYRTLRDRLIEHEVFMYPDSPVLEIREVGVHVAHNRELLFLKADTVILAVGSRPESKLKTELEWVVPGVYNIGDCVKPRDAMEAIREGAELARQI